MKGPGSERAVTKSSFTLALALTACSHAGAPNPPSSIARPMASGTTAVARGKPAPPDVAPPLAAPPTPTSPDTRLEPPAQPVAAGEVRKTPLPPGRCVGKYTDEARAAATEGVVVLDLTVDETGRTRDITVVQGLPHGLTEAAVAALEACRFMPGEREGKPIAVRVRGFKIRFLLGPPP